MPKDHGNYDKDRLKNFRLIAQRCVFVSVVVEIVLIIILVSVIIITIVLIY